MSLNALELNAEIERVEAAIVLREARLRGRVADLGQRVDEALPKVAAAGVVAAALGGLLLWLRPRRRRHAAPASEAAAAASAAGAPEGWLHWINLAWPLLPLSLRALVDLQLVVAIGKPLLAMFRRRPAAAPPAPPGSPDAPSAPPAGEGRTHG